MTNGLIAGFIFVAGHDGQPRRQLDVSKAEKAFGFKAKISFDVGLDETIEWFIENR